MGAAESQAVNISRAIFSAGGHMPVPRSVLVGTLFLFILVFQLNQVLSQFHRECVTQKALKSKVCCPTWNGSPCGENSGRGRCPVDPDSEFTSESEESYDHACLDDRMNWPRGYFEHYCECFGNYSGFNCGECKYGLYGEKCDRGKLLIRKELRNMNPEEREKFFRYLNLAKTTTSKDYVILVSDNRYDASSYCFVNASVYDMIAWIHHYAMKPILINCTTSKRNFAHQGPSFLVWHRLYLLFIERQLQLLTGDEDLALPFFNWSSGPNCSICTDDMLGSNDRYGRLSEDSRFASWEIICGNSTKSDNYCKSANTRENPENLRRNPGHSDFKTLPTFQDVENSFKWPCYDSAPYDRYAKHCYRNVIEGFVLPEDAETYGNTLHNQVHGYIGGSMSDVSVASNDPMFILHHSYVDCLFQDWTTFYWGSPDMYPENDLPGMHPLDFLVPFYPYYYNSDLLDTSLKFGYKYE